MFLSSVISTGNSSVLIIRTGTAFCQGDIKALATSTGHSAPSSSYRYLMVPSHISLLCLMVRVECRAAVIMQEYYHILQVNIRPLVKQEQITIL